MHVIGIGGLRNGILDDLKEMFDALGGIDIDIGDVLTSRVALKGQLQIAMSIQTLEAADESETRHRFMQSRDDGMK